jgi:flavodoxin
MKKILTFCIILLAGLFALSCEKVTPVNQEEKTNGEQTESGNEQNTPASGKILIAYYSYTGHCKEIVTALTDNLTADVLEIKAVDENVDYNANNYKAGSNLINAINANPDKASSYPEIKAVDRKAEDFDTIIIVTPLWHSRMAAITQTYLFQEGAKMKGKNVGLVVSSHSSGISGVESDAKRLIPEGKLYASSLWINNANHDKRADLVKDWLNTIGL